MPQPKLFRVIDKAIFEYNMIEYGDSILIGASGGKDSTVLIEYFAQRKKQGRDNFDFAALHIATEIAPPFPLKLKNRLEEWQVPLFEIQVDVLGRLKPNKKMNCWWCSTQRRTELNNFAIEKGFNKIVLGHHLDDILETLLMNALSKGELSTMPPRLQYNKYPVTIIRPLYFAPVDEIILHAKTNEYISSTCTCNYQDNSTRKEARERLKLLTNGSTEKKLKLLNSIRNIKYEYLT